MQRYSDHIIEDNVGDIDRYNAKSDCVKDNSYDISDNQQWQWQRLTTVTMKVKAILTKIVKMILAKSKHC